MTSLAQADGTTAEALWNGASDGVVAGQTLQEAADNLINSIYKELEGSLALSRAFVTAPHADLPADYQGFAKNLADTNDLSDQLKSDTPTLSLLATRGKEDAWNDVRKSEGHVAIPLLSGDFISAVPMLSKLLQEFGVGEGLVSGGVQISKDESAMRSFFVSDASISTDDQGRHIIPMQDFVSDYGVETVFGIGGPYWEGSQHVLVCIFFATEALDTSVLENLRPLFERFKSATGILVEKGEIFS